MRSHPDNPKRSRIDRWGTLAALLALVVLLAGAAATCGPRPRAADTDPTDPGGVAPAPGAPCAVSADCGGTRPVCWQGLCSPCRDDGDCVAWPDCRVCGASGACVRVDGCCRGDLDCPTSFRCERSAGRPVGRCLEGEGNR